MFCKRKKAAMAIFRLLPSPKPAGEKQLPKKGHPALSIRRRMMKKVLLFGDG
jgi:hypothetical protein